MRPRGNSGTDQSGLVYLPGGSRPATPRRADPAAYRGSRQPSCAYEDGRRQASKRTEQGRLAASRRRLARFLRLRIRRPDHRDQSGRAPQRSVLTGPRLPRLRVPASISILIRAVMLVDRLTPGLVRSLPAGASGVPWGQDPARPHWYATCCDQLNMRGLIGTLGGGSGRYEDEAEVSGAAREMADVTVRAFGLELRPDPHPLRPGMVRARRDSPEGWRHA